MQYYIASILNIAHKKNGTTITVIPLLNQTYVCFFQGKDTKIILVL